MSYLQNAATESIEDLVNITDAQTEEDPLGTDASSGYFGSNVHPYIKDLAKHALLKKTYFVGPGFVDMGKPHFPTISDALAQIVIDGCSPSDKATILLTGTNSSFTETINFNISGGYVVIGSICKNNNLIVGNVTVSAGTLIFEGIKHEGNLTITNGNFKAEKGSTQDSGTTSVNGNSKFVLTDCENWGVINVANNGNQVQIENVKFIRKDNLDRSIILTASITGGKYYFKRLELQGSLYEGVAANQVHDVNTNITERILI